MPHKTFPRALAAAVVLVVVTYALPLMIGLGVTRVVKDWKLGYFSYIAQQVSKWAHVVGGKQQDSCAAKPISSPPHHLHSLAVSRFSHTQHYHAKRQQVECEQWEM